MKDIYTIEEWKEIQEMQERAEEKRRQEERQQAKKIKKRYIKKLRLRKEVKQLLKDIMLCIMLTCGCLLSLLLLMWIESLNF